MKLEIGYRPHFELRHVIYPKAVGGGLRIVYLSDLHFCRFSAAMADRLISAVRELDPGLVLLGGDYVDSSTGLVYFERLLRGMAEGRTVVAVAGNHDWWRLRRLRGIVEHVGGYWLEGDGLCLELNGMRIRVDGRGAKRDRDREDRRDDWEDEELRILALHRPIDPVGLASRYDLIFAGHLHGCQWVLWETEKGLYPGRWFYRWNRLDWRSGDCHYLISKGLGDSLPMRLNCSKEILVVDIPNP